MRVAILGAGPAGLYLAYLIKRRHSSAEVRVFEQNGADATFGFGVVFSDRALEFLNEDDPETFAAIVPHCESWSDITVVHRGERVRIDGVGFAAIGRLKLLQLLQARVRSVGIEPTFRHPVADLRELGDADLIVGADGVNSLVRRAHQAAFGATIAYLTNRFAWFGTTQPFETLTQTFRRTDLGDFNAHHYRYAPDMSTFLVEVTEATFARAGFGRMSEMESAALCARVFAADLDDHPLLSNNSVWRRFPVVRNARWSHDRCVLIGDALHTAHFSIGSGTRLAMEDAIALDRALATHPADVPAALAAFEAARRPIVEKLVTAANASGAWYERFADHMALAPLDFAMNYLTRSGRIDPERLRQSSPRFAERYARER
ncbi:MAG: FAD-dependent monooxygenase [Hyphomicrobiales bacterium]|nr:FAD-dependent monooxygenase [Hyphomicrobiales bacterium]MBV8826786.1 FAD-dependent monooxygenase [Hyphomicrobiales bacterium]MBV9429246.1 FAD-dependent monooxygenase [Bradyrhizobiaceae bacterium]